MPKMLKSAPSNDVLLDCLLIINLINHKSISREVLSREMSEQSDISQFVRLAKKIGYQPELVKRKASKLAKLPRPFIALLANHGACVVSDIDKKSQFKIVSASGTEQTLCIKEFNKNYSGRVIVMEAEYQFSEQTEKLMPRKSKQWFWQVVRESIPIYREVLLASFLINMFALATPFFIMNVYDRVVPNNALSTLWVLASGILVIILFDLLMRILRGYFIDFAGKRIEVELSSNIFEQLLNLKMASRPNSVGALANSYSSFESFRELISSAAVNILIDLPFVVIFLLVIWYIGGVIAFIPMLAIPIVLLLTFILQVPINRKIIELFRFNAEKHATLVESLSAAETVKTLNAENKLQFKWQQIMQGSAKHGMRIRYLTNLATNLSVFVQQLATILVIITGVYLIGEGEITLGGLIACTILTGRALFPLAQFASIISRYFQSSAAFSAVSKLMQSETDYSDIEKCFSLPQSSGKIELRDVSFAYPNQEFVTLNNCSFKINPKERVGIIGRMGSGKSTVARLLMGLYKTSAGHILIDDVDMQQINPYDIRNNFSYLSQDIVLFNGTIKENICYGHEHVDDAQLLHIAKISGVEEIVKNHPDGYDLQIVEMGKNLSGGEKQTIAMARALLSNAPILLLDEPSNFMDDRSSSAIMKNIETLAEDKTLILITHNARILTLVDRLIVIHGGKIIADGEKDLILKALAESKIKAD